MTRQLAHIPLTLATACLLGSTALAGSPKPAPAPEPEVIAPAPPATPWAGPFLGAQIGAATGTADLTFDTGTSEDFDIDGGFAGIYGGYDIQNGPMVFGVDVAYNGADISGDSDLTGDISDLESSIETFGALRGRVGRTFDNVLVYGAAGFAFGTAEVSGVSGSTSYEDDDVSLNGWTAGIGAQTMLNDSWAVRGEIAYTDYGEEDVDWAAFAPEADFDMTTVTVGVERRF